MTRRWRAGALATAVALAVAACGSGDGGGPDEAAREPTTTTTGPAQAQLVLTPTSLSTTVTSAASTTAPSSSADAAPSSTADASGPGTTGEPSAEQPASTTTRASSGAAAAPAPTAPPATTAPPPTTPPTTAAPPATVPPPPEPYLFEAAPISAEVAARMTPTSWRPGCPVPLEDLRYLRLSYWGFDSASHVGELVVHRDAAQEVGAAFAELYANRFPIARMRLVDDFGGDDDVSIDADNTSAFNCRPVTGSTNRWSQHAYGQAIDINPIENPYIGSSGSIAHPASEPYRDRSTYRLGMFVEGHVGVAAFDRFGWDWGGRWSSPIDYQHFSRTGG